MKNPIQAAAELSDESAVVSSSRKNNGGVWGWAKGWAMGSGGGDGAGGRGGGVGRSGETRGSMQHHDHCLFMLRVSGETLFGMSHFLRVEVGVVGGLSVG